VRIKRDLKQEAERLGINIRNVLEKALNEELEKSRRQWEGVPSHVSSS